MRPWLHSPPGKDLKSGDDLHSHFPVVPSLCGFVSGGQDEQYRLAPEGEEVLPVQDGEGGGGVERLEELQGGLLHLDQGPHSGG